MQTGAYRLTLFFFTGSNQAVMSAKLGLADPNRQKNIFVCCIGNDANGTKMINNFEEHQFFNVKKHIRVLDNIPSGLANVMVDTNTGFNRIIIVAGANALLSKEHVDQSWSEIEEHCSVLVCQLETSVDVALHAFRQAKQSKSTILTGTLTLHFCNCLTFSKKCSILPLHAKICQMNSCN